MRLNQVAAEFRKVSNKQMAETTKRTIRENVSINAQLAKMSDKTMELIQENDELRTKEKKMKLQIDMLEHNEKELAKKNSSNQKVNRQTVMVIFGFSGLRAYVPFIKQWMPLHQESAISTNRWRLLDGSLT